MAKKKYYGVRKGYKTGIFDSWDDCKNAVSGYPGAEFKGFKTIQEANEYVGNVSEVVNEVREKNVVFKKMSDGKTSPQKTVTSQKPVEYDVSKIARNLEKVDIVFFEEQENGDVVQTTPSSKKEKTDKNILIGNDMNYEKDEDFFIKMKNPSEENSTLVAYVDGSYNQFENIYGSGILIFSSYDDIKRISIRGIDEEMASMRNVSGEIIGSEAAMIVAVKNGYSNLKIYYDYTGIEKWAKGEWKRNKNGTKRYKKSYDIIKSNLNVDFCKVKAHSGNRLNDEADYLAKNGAGI